MADEHWLVRHIIDILELQCTVEASYDERLGWVGSSGERTVADRLTIRADASEDESGPAAPAAPVAVAPKKSSKWADEDAEDDVLDDWEAESDSEAERKKAAAAAAAGPAKPIRNKGVTRQKIAEKEAQEVQERLAAEARAEEEADPVARKAREQKRTLDADMENARGLFGEASISSGSLSRLRLSGRTKGAEGARTGEQMLEKISLGRRIRGRRSNSTKWLPRCPTTCSNAKAPNLSTQRQLFERAPPSLYPR